MFIYPPMPEFYKIRDIIKKFTIFRASSSEAIPEMQALPLVISSIITGAQ